MKHIPNIITFVRILLIGVFIYYFAKMQYLCCIITYSTAFFSDILDGFLARRFGWISNIGKILDPLADKLMLLAATGCFCYKGWLPLTMFLIIAVKETVMILGGLLLYRKDVVVYSDMFGKLATGFFTASVLSTLLKVYPAFSRIGEWNLVLFLAAIVLALIALAHYAKMQVWNRSRG